MKIILAEKIGFCSGVKRAIELAERSVQEGRKPVYTLGPLIHNPQEVARLARLGIQIADKHSEISKGIVIIPAHGLPPDLLKELGRQKDIEFVDATCPIVKRVQICAKNLVEENYEVIIVGDKGHPEVSSILGFTGNRGHVVENISELNQLKLSSSSRIGLVAQTTQSEETFSAIVNAVMQKGAITRVYNTICSATFERQQALRKLVPRVEAVIVIGGYNSANTNRLVKIAKEMGCDSVYHIETTKDLNLAWIKNKEKIGIAAGTSTPTWIIDEVVDYLSKL